MKVWKSSYASPIGTLTLFAKGDALSALHLPKSSGEDAPVGEPPVLALARAQLDAYFAGTRTEFELPLAPEGTAFEQAVWNALLKIPFGVTTSYAEIARAIGKPKAARAVGAANGRNPIAIIVPCHRVIGASGSLVGYGGGLPLKRWLLAHESRSRQECLTFAR